jgi:cation diffusion facilitator family transporter
VTCTPIEKSTKTVVYAALAGNLLVAATKAGAAAWTGSSAMLSEAIHSFVDTGNEVLLLYGMRQADRHADPEHPLGYGRELYFWSFVVALLIFALGAGVSIYQGIAHLGATEPIRDPLVNYVVLGLAFLFEGGSWLVSVRQFRSAKGELGYYEAFRKSKDPPSFMVLFEDSAALIGIVIAAIGTFASTQLGMPRADGIASIAIGLVLALTSMLLARESKSLLIGERANRTLSDSILRIAGAEPSVARANGVLTAQLGPDQILAALSLEFADDLRATDIENAVVDIEHKVRAAHPEVLSLFVKPQTARTFKENVQARYGDAAPKSA